MTGRSLGQRVHAREQNHAGHTVFCEMIFWWEERNAIKQELSRCITMEMNRLFSGGKACWNTVLT